MRGNIIINMKKMLLITNADLGPNAGNTTLVARRATELFKQKNIFTRCICVTREIHSLNGLNYEGISFEQVLEKEELKRIIVEDKPDYITFYGFKVLLLYHYTKKVLKEYDIHSMMLFDVQACNEEKKEYGESFIKGAIQCTLQNIILRYIVNHIDGCFVVSDELEDYCRRFLRKNWNTKFYKVRCGINELFDESEMENNRKIIRNQLNLTNDHIVFVYSGFRTAWQKVDEIIKQFQVYDSLYPEAFFCFFCNSDSEFEHLLKSCFPRGNYLVKFLSLDEYFKYLFACDIGFLIRDYNMTNKVAFPNKFSDYLSSGLIIAINGALFEPIRILNKYKQEYINTDECPAKNLPTMIKERKKDIHNFYINNNNITRNEILYSSQISKIEL